jgi:hypothetical protein
MQAKLPESSGNSSGDGCDGASRRAGSVCRMPNSGLRQFIQREIITNRARNDLEDGCAHIQLLTSIGQPGGWSGVPGRQKRSGAGSLRGLPGGKPAQANGQRKRRTRPGLCPPAGSVRDATRARRNRPRGVFSWASEKLSMPARYGPLSPHRQGRSASVDGGAQATDGTMHLRMPFRCGQPQGVGCLNQKKRVFVSQVIAGVWAFRR